MKNTSRSADDTKAMIKCSSSNQKCGSFSKLNFQNENKRFEKPIQLCHEINGSPTQFDQYEQ